MSISANDLVLAWGKYISLFGEAPHGTLKQMAALIELLPKPETEQPVELSVEKQATEIIERVWNVWYGDHRGDMPSDRFAITLGIAKQGIIAALRCAVEKSDAEMLRVKACEHIAEGEEGWEALRKTCPSTMAVAELRDKYEVLLKRESGEPNYSILPYDVKIGGTMFRAGIPLETFINAAKRWNRDAGIVFMKNVDIDKAREALKLPTTDIEDEDSK